MAEFNVLGQPCEPLGDADAEVLCLQALRRAAEGDPKWAAWYLEHSPTTSSTWSDLAVQYRIEREVVAKVVRAILAFGFHPQEQMRFLLCLKAEGVETILANVRDSNTAEGQG